MIAIEPMHIISLGAGVQSSTMALMAAAGEITPMPAVAVFADTHDEPRSVYRWLDWLEPMLPFPIVRVSIGKLSLAATAVRHSASGRGYLKPALPAYLGAGGMQPRQCTLEYKVTPIRRYANQIRGDRQVLMWIGISTDEAHRMKPSQLNWYTHHYPLIDSGVSRGACLTWMAARSYPQPPRSSCVYCPFHSDDEWRRLRDDEPIEFARAVAFEREYQNAAAQTALQSLPYLHASRIPLDHVVFSADQQADMFGADCEGMCGT